jgi:hypothetical protein
MNFRVEVSVLDTDHLCLRFDRFSWQWMSVVVFWVVMPYNVVGGSQHFGRMYLFHLECW